MRNAGQRFNLAVGVVLTTTMLFFAVVKGFVPGYLLAFLGIVFIAAALVNLRRSPRR